MIQAAKATFEESIDQSSKKRRTSVASFTYFFTLPEEISFHIISFLDAKDLCELAKASHELRRMAQENLVWKRLCKQSGWRVAPEIVREARSMTASNQFDYKKYFSEKAVMNRKGSLSWNTPKTHGVAPTKRFKHSATAFGKFVIFIGGQETDTKRFNEVIYFDTENGTFTRPTLRGDTPPNFSRHSSVLVNGRVFIFGGFDGFGTNFELSIFNPVTYTWTNVLRSQVRGDAPPSRTNHAAAAVGNKMYMFGGNNNNAAGQYQVLDDFYCLDTDTLTWTNLTTAVGGTRPTQRSGHTLTTIGTKMYLFGGGVWNEANGWVHKYNDIYVFDALQSSWSKPTCTGDIDTSTFSISFAVGRFLFVFGGGSKPKHCVTNDLFVLDTSSYSWTAPSFEEATKPSPRDMGTACVIGSNVFFMGGYAGGAVDYFNKLSLDTKPVFEQTTWVPLCGSGAY
jgi:Rab9 effector protein with kelch motifs